MTEVNAPAAGLAPSAPVVPPVAPPAPPAPPAEKPAEPPAKVESAKAAPAKEEPVLVVKEIRVHGKLVVSNRETQVNDRDFIEISLEDGSTELVLPEDWVTLNQ